MTRKLVSLAAALLLAALPIAASGTTATDWILVRVPIVGPEAEVQIQGRVSGTGEAPILVGFGSAFLDNSVVFVDDLRNGGIHVKTTEDGGALDVAITEGEQEGFGFTASAGLFGSSGPSGPSPAGALSLLFFVANGVLDELSVESSPGTVPEIHTGSGSRAVSVGGPGTTGPAVDASAAAAGASSIAASTDRGLIGGAVLGCTKCTVEWKTSDGETGSLTQTNAPLPFILLPVPVPLPILPTGFGEGDLGFAGPAGVWRWSWTGAAVSTTPSPAVVVAYAPVGELWQLFRGGGPSGSAFGAQPAGGSAEEPAIDPGGSVGADASKRATEAALPGTGLGENVALGLCLIAAAAILRWLVTRSWRDSSSFI